MKFALFALLLVALSAFAAKQDLSERAAWRDACTLSRYDCTGVKPPMIRESVILEAEMKLLGLYFGGNTVWLRPGMKPELRYAVTVHEMVHYLQAVVDGDGPPFEFKGEACLREEESYEISDIVAKRLGIEGQMNNADKLRASCTQSPVPITDRQ